MLSAFFFPPRQQRCLEKHQEEDLGSGEAAGAGGVSMTPQELEIQKKIDRLYRSQEESQNLQDKTNIGAEISDLQIRYDALLEEILLIALWASSLESCLLETIADVEG